MKKIQVKIRTSNLETIKSIRIPLPPKGFIMKPKKGKGSYKRKEKKIKTCQ